MPARQLPHLKVTFDFHKIGAEQDTAVGAVVKWRERTVGVEGRSRIKHVVDTNLNRGPGEIPKFRRMPKDISDERIVIHLGRDLDSVGLGYSTLRQKLRRDRGVSC